MILHHNKDEFASAVKYTAELMGIPTINIEKDYWVTYALFALGWRTRIACAINNTS